MSNKEEAIKIIARLYCEKYSVPCYKCPDCYARDEAKNLIEYIIKAIAETIIEKEV